MRARLRRRAQRILNVSGLTRAEWSILLTGDDPIRELNSKYRNVDVVTDVLSFGIDGEVHGDDAPLIGDVVISVPQAMRQTVDNAEAEIVRLLAHGLCHLRGFDHQSEQQRLSMDREEQRLLQAVGLDKGLVARLS